MTSHETVRSSRKPDAVKGPSFASRFKGRIIRAIPRPLLKIFAAPYIAGETRVEAVTLARQLHEKMRLSSTLDLLGEALCDPRESGVTLREHIAILDDLEALPYANISIKLSALGQAIDEELCARNLETLLEHAARTGQFVRFDMEDHTTTTSSLGFFRKMIVRYPNIGTVLQSRLHRTRQDVEDLASLKPNVRLCLGIYREPPDIALQDKPAMKERFLELLEMLWDNGQYVAVATHDEVLIHRSLELADRMGKTERDFEVQMLQGVPRRKIQEEIIARGITVRLYLPYGRDWYNYCSRRLQNNPEMARMVVVNLLRRGSMFFDRSAGVR